MEELLKIIKPYNIFTTLYPGYLFVVFCENSLQDYIITVHEKSVLVGICFCYFIGTLINRVGSLIVEKIACKIRIVKYVEYGDYIEATKNDEKIEMLLQVNNTYRSLSALFLVLMFMHFLPLCALEWFGYNFVYIAFIIFLAAYRKQTGYVVGRINKTLDRSNE